jgi:hypothetical protein
MNEEFIAMRKETWEQKSHLIWQEGYQPKPFIIEEIDGKEVKVSVAGLKLIPPKGGTAVVRPGRKQPL